MLHCGEANELCAWHHAQGFFGALESGVRVRLFFCSTASTMAGHAAISENFYYDDDLEEDPTSFEDDEDMYYIDDDGSIVSAKEVTNSFMSGLGKEDADVFAENIAARKSKPAPKQLTEVSDETVERVKAGLTNQYSVPQLVESDSFKEAVREQKYMEGVAIPHDKWSTARGGDFTLTWTDSTQQQKSQTYV